VLILNRGRQRAPNLRSSDGIIAGLCTLLMRPARVLRSAIVLKTSTLLHFHKMLIQQKYRVLFSPKRARRPGPKSPAKELIDAVLEMKRRNCTWGCKRIAEQIDFGIRRRHRQRRGPPDSRNTLPSGSRVGRSVLAFLYRERERLAVVVGFISMRVCNIANVLGFGRDGSIYTPDRRLCCSP